MGFPISRFSLHGAVKLGHGDVLQQVVHVACIVAVNDQATGLTAARRRQQAQHDDLAAADILQLGDMVVCRCRRR